MKNKKWSIEKCCAYIETHWDREIAIKKLAEKAGYSYKYFCHWFSVCSGTSVSSYIRQERLRRGAEALAHGKTLTEAADIAKYETASGFCKAFQQKYLLSPKEYREQYQLVKRPKFVTITEQLCVCYGIPPYEDKEWNPFHNAAHWLGASIETVSVAEYQKLAKAGRGEVGFWSEYDKENGNRTYFFGPIVDDFKYVPQGMVEKKLPASKYAVFPTIPVNIARDKYGFRASIEEVKKYVCTVWFQSSADYAIDEEKTMFEFYPSIDDTSHGDNAVEIFVPIIEKRRKR